MDLKPTTTARCDGKDRPHLCPAFGNVGRSRALPVSPHGDLSPPYAQQRVILRCIDTVVSIPRLSERPAGKFQRVSGRPTHGFDNVMTITRHSDDTFPLTTS